MIVGYKEIRKRIQEVWPKCKNVWLSDLEYDYPSYDEIRAIILSDHTERLAMKGYKFDCDDFALQLSAAVSRYRGRNAPEDAMCSYSFGSVKGRRFKYMDEPHNCNICVLRDTIILIEPQTDEIWEGDAVEDDIYFVAMP